MLEGIEFVSRLITQYFAVEQMYAIGSSKLAASLQHSLLTMYVSILQYLVYYFKFLDHNGFKRFIKGLNPNSLEEVKGLLRRIEEAKMRVDSDASHLNNEWTRNGIDNILQGQKYLILQQQDAMNAQRDLVDGQNLMRRTIDERTVCFRNILEEWQNDFGTVQDHISDIYRDTVVNPNVKRISDWLSTIRHDQHHAAAQKDILQSSGRWLLEHSDFREWKESAQSSVLWMHGYLGTGKTRLVSVVIEYFKATMKDALGPGRLAYFYCSRNEAGSDNNKGLSARGEPVEVIRSIVKQLARSRAGEGLEALVTDKFSQLKGTDTEDPPRPSMRECVDLIILLSKTAPTSIIVDGLDECRQTVVRDLIQSFHEIVVGSAKHVKVFLSTRYVSAIVDHLRRYDYTALEVSSDKNSGDIARFIDVELEKRIQNRSLLHGNVSDSLRSEIRQVLGHRAGSMFWYASLQLNLLCDPTAEQDEAGVKQKLMESPTTLKEAYAQILQDIDDPKNSWASRSVARNTMSWLLCSQQALSRGAILEAVSEGTVDPSMVIRVCRSLIIEDHDNDVFEFAHLSVREHLEQTHEYGRSEQHLVAAERCLKMLETSILSRAMNHNTTSVRDEFRRYAFLFWPFHYQQVDFSSTNERKEKLRTKLKSLLIRGSGVSSTFKSWISAVSAVKEMQSELYNDQTYLPSYRQSRSLHLPLYRQLRSLQASPESALFTACAFGFPDLVRQFRRTKGFDFDQYNDQGQSALCLAVENNQIETVENLLVDLPKPYSPPLNANQVNLPALIQYRACRQDSKPSTFTYATALQAAAAHGLEAMTRYLIEKGANVDLVAGYHGNALQAAALNGCDTLVEILLEEYQAEPNNQGGFHGNALQAAAINGNAKTITLLIGHGALVSAPGGHYDNALMAAVCSGSIEVLELLLEQKADVNVESILYGTPLQKAADMNNKELLERLIAEGAEINVGETDNSGHGQAQHESALATAAWGGHFKIVSILLENGAQADVEYHRNGFKLLHQAASRGMLDLLQYCIDEKGCDVDMVTVDRHPTFLQVMTPLAIACVEGHLDVVDFLLERGASIEYDGDTLTTLSLAACRGHSQIINSLIKYSNTSNGPDDTQRFIDRPSSDLGRSALHEAVSGGSFEAIETLLDWGAKYYNSNDGTTPLHTAVNDQRLDIVLLLIEFHLHGRIIGEFSIDARSTAGATPLLLAMSRDNAAITRVLLTNGAKPDLCDPANNTALHHAVRLDRKDFCQMMLSSFESAALSALLEMKNSSNNTALAEAVTKRHYELITMLLAFGAKWHHNEDRETDIYRAAKEDKSLVQEYIRAFAESDELKCFVNSPNAHKKTPLHAAAEFNQPDAVRMLLEAGADLFALDDCSRTALFWAAESGHTDCVKALLDFARHHSADIQRYIDHRTTWDIPALHEAIMHRRLGSVRLLLDHGADFMSCGLRNETALTLAAQDEHQLGYQYCVPIVDQILRKAKERSQLVELIDSYNAEGATCLLQTCINDLPEITARLLAHGASYFTSTKYNVTPLHIACWMNKQRPAIILLESAVQDQDQGRFRAFLDQLDHWSRTALNAAACAGNTELVALLLEKYHADYTISCSAEDVPEPLFTPLHYAATKGYHKMTEVLLNYVARDADEAKRAAFINAKHGFQRKDTALIAAATRKRVGIVRALLGAGADYSLTDKYQATALIMATCSGDLSTVRALLDFVADQPDRPKVEAFLNTPNRFGKTPLIDGAERDFSTIVKALIETPSVDYTIQDESGFTALHWSAFKNSRGAAAAILEFASKDTADDGKRFKAFLNARAHRNGHTALFDAASNGHIELTKSLLETYHAEYDTYDNKGASPLHFAVRRNQFPVAEVYLTYASVNKEGDGGRFDTFLSKRDDTGKTALELAIENNNGRLMELLRKHLSRPLVVRSNV